jgi:hypothetical protein
MPVADAGPTFASAATMLAWVWAGDWVVVGAAVVLVLVLAGAVVVVVDPAAVFVDDELPHAPSASTATTAEAATIGRCRRIPWLPLLMVDPSSGLVS